METKIAPSRLRDMRFPKSDEKPNSEIKTYTLSPEEIRQKYGPANSEILTEECFWEMRKAGMNFDQIAKKLNIHRNIVKTLANQYLTKKKRNEAVVQVEKQEEKPVGEQENDQTKGKLTKEEYLKLKEQGFSNVGVAQKYGITDATVYYYLKKWGLHPQPKQEAVQEIAIEKPDDVETEVKSEPIPAEENHHETKLNAVIHLPGCFEQIGKDIGALVDEKNAAYGNSFAKSGEFLKILYPDGLQPEQYLDALLLVRIFDKQMRIANKKNAFGESPYHDIAGYGILGASR